MNPEAAEAASAQMTWHVFARSARGVEYPRAGVESERESGVLAGLAGY